jgi:hypothetical protein
MKTPQEWAEYLPEPIRTEFLNNLNKFDVKEQPTKETLVDAITDWFVWEWTPQGHNYWLSVKLLAENNGFSKLMENNTDSPKSIQLLRDVETEINISGIISNHTYSKIVKLLKEIDGNQNNK